MSKNNNDNKFMFLNCMNGNSDVNSFLYSRCLLYLVLFVSLINLFYLLNINNTNAVIVFFLIGFITSFFIKNMIIIIFFSMIVAFLFQSANQSSDEEEYVEGMENEEEEEEDKMEGMENEEEEEEDIMEGMENKEEEEEEVEGMENEEEEEEVEGMENEEEEEEDVENFKFQYQGQNPDIDSGGSRYEQLNEKKESFKADMNEYMTLQEQLLDILKKTEPLLNQADSLKEKYENQN